MRGSQFHCEQQIIGQIQGHFHGAIFPAYQLSVKLASGNPLLLGFDHEKFTYRYAGLDYRLTGVGEEAKVIHDVIA